MSRAAFGLWVVSVLLLSTRSADAQMIERVSVSTHGTEADRASRRVVLSADGRFSAFASEATNLVSDDGNDAQDVFWRDRDSGETRLVSRSSSGAVGNAASGPSCSSCVDGVALSGDGRFVAFSSVATNLVTGTGGHANVYVHDTQTGLTECVSRGLNGSPGNERSFEPSVSGDGRWVAFRSLADDLVAGDTNFESDVFVADRATGTIRRASMAATGSQSDGGSYAPALSRDGRYVAFESEAGNLVTGDDNSVLDIFVCELASGSIERVSVDHLGREVFADSVSPFLSGDGRFVVFHSTGGNFVPGDTNQVLDVFLYDRSLDRIERASLTDSGGEPDHVSWRASVTDDGRFVAFESWASNMVPEDTSRDRDCFLRDRFARRTVQVTLDASDGQANSSSFLPAISASGRTLAFESLATNLVPDSNGVADIFFLDRFRVDPEGTATPGAPFRFVVQNAHDEVGNYAQVLLSCSGTAGFPLPDGSGRWIPLTYDTCTQLGLTYSTGLSGDIGGTGSLRTRTLAFPPLSAGLNFWIAAVTFDRASKSYPSISPPRRFTVQ